MNLFLLDTTAPVLLGGLNRGLVALGPALGHEATTGLEGTGKITSSGLAEDVNLGQVGLEGALEGDDGLDKEGVGVLEVQVHHTHHADTHKLAAEQLAQLSLIVVHVGGRHGLGLLGATHRGGLNVLEGCHVWRYRGLVRVWGCGEHAIGRHTLLLVDLKLGVQVDSQDENIRQDIASAHQHQDLGILKGNLLGQLHHHQDDGEVGTVRPLSVSVKIDLGFESKNCRSSIHLSRHHFAGYFSIWGNR